MKHLILLSFLLIIGCSDNETNTSDQLIDVVITYCDDREPLEVTVKPPKISSCVCGSVVDTLKNGLEPIQTNSRISNVPTWRGHINVCDVKVLRKYIKPKQVFNIENYHPLTFY